MDKQGEEGEQVHSCPSSVSACAKLPVKFSWERSPSPDEWLDEWLDDGVMVRMSTKYQFVYNHFYALFI